MSARCGTCRFWQERDDSGYCRFNPPTVIVQTVHGGRYGKTDMQRNIYPKTLKHEWCGRHEPTQE